MRINSRKVFSIILLSLSLCACGNNGTKNNMQESRHISNESSQEILSGDDITQKKIQLELDNVENKHMHYLNNRATSFGDYLYVHSINAYHIFSDKDEQGNYYSWQVPEDLLSETMNVHYLFKYEDQLICICTNEKGDEEVIIYDSNLIIQSRKDIEFFSPRYVCGNLLYGYSNSTEYTTIKTINLESLEIKNIYSSALEKRLDFIINNNEDIIISKSSDKMTTCYFKYDKGLLTPLTETKNSALLFYDSRGLFYLEESNTNSQWNLICWDGNNSRMIGEIKTDDMDEWIFNNGFPGNIIIEDEFFASIHTIAEDPYVLIQRFDSKESKRISLKKWPFTEADMGRFGETFSGIHYENGQIVNYFFSNKAGMLQTQTLDLS